MTDARMDIGKRDIEFKVGTEEDTEDLRILSNKLRCTSTFS